MDPASGCHIGIMAQVSCVPEQGNPAARSRSPAHPLCTVGICTAGNSCHTELPESVGLVEGASAQHFAKISLTRCNSKSPSSDIAIGKGYDRGDLLFDG